MPIPRPAPGNTKWWVIGTTGVLLGCALAVWIGPGTAPDRATGGGVGFRAGDDGAVDGTARRRRPVGRDATCGCRALDKGVATVGLGEVHIPGSDVSTVQRTTRVRTTTRAVTGLVRSCAVG